MSDRFPPLYQDIYKEYKPDRWGNIQSFPGQRVGLHPLLKEFYKYLVDVCENQTTINEALWFVLHRNCYTKSFDPRVDYNIVYTRFFSRRFTFNMYNLHSAFISFLTTCK